MSEKARLEKASCIDGWQVRSKKDDTTLHIRCLAPFSASPAMTSPQLHFPLLWPHLILPLRDSPTQMLILRLVDRAHNIPSSVEVRRGSRCGIFPSSLKQTAACCNPRWKRTKNSVFCPVHCGTTFTRQIEYARRRSRGGLTKPVKIGQGPSLLTTNEIGERRGLASRVIEAMPNVKVSRCSTLSYRPAQ